MHPQTPKYALPASFNLPVLSSKSEGVMMSEAVHDEIQRLLTVLEGVLVRVSEESEPGILLYEVECIHICDALREEVINS